MDKLVTKAIHKMLSIFILMCFSLFVLSFRSFRYTKKAIQNGHYHWGSGMRLFVMVLVIVGVYAVRQRKRAEKATELINPFGNSKCI